MNRFNHLQENLLDPIDLEALHYTTKFVGNLHYSHALPIAKVCVHSKKYK